MKKMELIAPCHFGLEAVLKREILDLGYDISEVEDGRVAFYGDAEAICRANIFLRTAERVLLKVGSFKANSLKNYLRRQRHLPTGKIIFRRMENSGLRKQRQLKVNYSAIGYPVSNEKGNGKKTSTEISCRVV